MSEQKEHKEILEKCFFDFINYLDSLGPENQKKTYDPAKQNKRAVLAHLRRGLEKPPGTAMEMLPYVIPHLEKLPADLSRSQREKIEHSYFLVGSLVGLYPKATWKSEDKGRNNVGKSLWLFDRELKRGNPNPSKDERNPSLEKRFVGLLNSNEEDLPNHLRQIISLLKSKEIPINWLRLLKDTQGWSHDEKYVQRNWAKEFWGNNNTGNEEKGEE